MIDAWRHAGKTIGKEIMTLKSNKPIPPADSVRECLGQFLSALTNPSGSEPTFKALARCAYTQLLKNTNLLLISMFLRS
jgi:hypothetical protein